MLNISVFLGAAAAPDPGTIPSATMPLVAADHKCVLPQWICMAHVHGILLHCAASTHPNSTV